MAHPNPARPISAAPLQAAAGAAGTRPSRARYRILGLLAIGTMINYLDRTVLGIAAPQLTKELGINAALMGLIFSAFSWSYVASQIPGGVFLDRFGSKLTYYLSMTLWSLCTLAQGLVTGVAGLFACRLGLGVTESPCFPTNSRVVATWFPQRERAFARPDQEGDCPLRRGCCAVHSNSSHWIPPQVVTSRSAPSPLGFTLGASRCGPFLWRFLVHFRLPQAKGGAGWIVDDA